MSVRLSGIMGFSNRRVTTKDAPMPTTNSQNDITTAFSSFIPVPAKVMDSKRPDNAPKEIKTVPMIVFIVEKHICLPESLDSVSDLFGFPISMSSPDDPVVEFSVMNGNQSDAEDIFLI